MRRTALLVTTVTACAGAWRGGAPARAEGLVVVGGSPRAIGRAGAGAASDDGGGALLINPAGLARRDSTRAQVGISLVDPGLTWAPAAPDAPVARSQAGSSMLPLIALATRAGGWVLGAGAMTSLASARAWRDPRDLPPAAELGPAFGYRYAGVAGRLRRDTLALGVARRLGDTVALGASLTASRLAVGETRRVWAGFEGVVPVGDPRRDVQLDVDGVDGFVPGATLGVLIAPLDTPLELAASIGWTARAALTGGVAGAGTIDGPALALDAPTARLEVASPLALRGGARYLGERVAAELGVDVWPAPADARSTAWALTGVRVTDPSSASTALTALPSRLSTRMQAAVRGAVDVELIAGLLWATAGYAYAVGGTEADRLSPTFGTLGGHTLALGIEGSRGGIAFTLGWSRTLASARAGGGALAHDNPFAAGDGPLPAGTYDGAVDQVGVLVDVEL